MILIELSFRVITKNKTKEKMETETGKIWVFMQRDVFIRLAVVDCDSIFCLCQTPLAY